MKGLPKWLFEKSDNGLVVIEAPSLEQAASVVRNFVDPEVYVLKCETYYGKTEPINVWK